MSADERGNAPPRFAEVSCSQCGKSFGPGDSGFSHCADHSAPTPATVGELSDAECAGIRAHVVGTFKSVATTPHDHTAMIRAGYAAALARQQPAPSGDDEVHGPFDNAADLIAALRVDDLLFVLSIEARVVAAAREYTLESSGPNFMAMVNALAELDKGK